MVFTPILVSYPTFKRHLLILLDLKTNRVAAYDYLLKPWGYNHLITFINNQVGNGKLTPGDTVLHTIKQNPFTTKAFAHFLLENQLDLSYYDRATVLPQIIGAKAFFQHFLDPQKINSLPCREKE